VAPGVNVPVIGVGGIHRRMNGTTPAATFIAARLVVYSRSHSELSGRALVEAFYRDESVRLPALEGKVQGARALY